MRGANTFKVIGAILGMPFKDQSLCEDCQNDLKTARQEGTPGKMSFNGPFLVRQEDGYWVASLPVSEVVSYYGTDTFDWRQRLDEIKNSVRYFEKSLKEKKTARLLIYQTYEISDSADIDKELEKLKRASKDSNYFVKSGAEEAIKIIESSLEKNTSDNSDILIQIYED